MMGRFRTSDLGDDQGSQLVEFAFVLVLLLTILLGIMDFCRFLYTYHFVSEVAREGTRYAVVRGYTFHGTACTFSSSNVPKFACDATVANIQTYVQDLTPPGINSTNLTVTPTWPATTPDSSTNPTLCATNSNTPGCYVKVVVSYPFHFMLPFLPSSVTTYTVTSTSEMVIQQ
jgi:Flp pilus assembly protein TadG